MTNRWQTVRLGETCEINPRGIGRDIPADEEVTFVPMAAVDETEGVIARPESRRYSEVCRGYTPFTNGDVLFAKITPCMQNGKAAVATELRKGLGFGSTEFHVLRPKGELLSRWVFHFVRRPQFRAAAEASFTGTAGQQRVPADFMKSAMIPVPPLTEQERIVGLLDEADALRQLRQQADRRTAEFIPALFHEMFGDPGKNPKRWPMTTLGDVAGKGQYGLNTSATTDPTGVRFIRITDVDERGQLGRCEPAYVPDSIADLEHYELREGDILIARSGATAGKSYVHEPLPERSVFAGYMIRFVVSRAKAHPLFVFWFLQTQSYWAQLKSHKRAVAQPNVNAQQLASLRFPLPPVGLQREFAERVAEVRALETAQAQSRQRLDDLFASLLDRAFKGEL